MPEARQRRRNPAWKRESKGTCCLYAFNKKGVIRAKPEARCEGLAPDTVTWEHKT